jgi:hypothetical protein
VPAIKPRLSIEAHSSPEISGDPYYTLLGAVVVVPVLLIGFLLKRVGWK